MTSSTTCWGTQRVNAIQSVIDSEDDRAARLETLEQQRVSALEKRIANPLPTERDLDDLENVIDEHLENPGMGLLYRAVLRDASHALRMTGKLPQTAVGSLLADAIRRRADAEAAAILSAEESEALSAEGF